MIELGERFECGVLITPFHETALMSPATSAGDVDRHTVLFGQAAHELTAR
jgi:glutamate-1-semialdehyde 2,1-aminomutase